MAQIYIFINADVVGSGKVKVTNTDNSSGYLNDEIVVGSSKVTKTVLNPGFNETLSLDIDESQIDHDALLNFVDAEHKPLDDGTTTTSSLWSSDKVQTELDLKQDLSEKGVANGYASLDAGGKLPASQLTTLAMEFKGAWNASTNFPVLVDGTGDTGDLYRANVSGTVNLGSGAESYNVGDTVIYNGSVWQKIPATDSVTSVFTRLGDITAQSGDYDADQIDYDNTSSGLTATDAQAAIDEVEGRVDTAETAISDHLADAVDAHDATAISYDNTTSSLTAIEVQAAIDEVEGRLDTAETGLSDHLSDAVDAHDASAVSYDNTTSSMVATEAQAAIDEIDGRVDSLESTDTQILVSSNDTTPKYLEDAIVVASGANATNILEVSTLNDGVDEDFQIQIDEAKIDHDALSNFVANEHIDHSSVNVNTNADSGLSGGGDITASRTLSVDIVGTTAETSANGSDKILINNGDLRSMTRSDFLSGIATTSTGDLPEASFSLANTQTTPASITGFSFANGSVRSFQAIVSIVVDATADLYEEREIHGIQKGSDWEISQSAVGDNSLVDFDIDSVGQLTYTTPTYVGFVGAVVKFRSIVTSV